MAESILYDFKGSTFDEMVGALSEPVILYTGAGLSMTAPTCAPSWWTLTQEILKAFFSRVEQLGDLTADFNFKIDRQPEEVFENFATILGDQLFEVFGSLDVGRPNPSHTSIARLMKVGKVKAVITTNFDRFLEQALENEGVEYHLIVTNHEYDTYLADGCPGPAVLKVHGTIERPDTIVSVASQYKSAKGFSIPKADVFSKLMEDHQCVFLGFSGWDFTHSNYRAFWKRCAPSLKGIIWNVMPGETEGPPLREIIPARNFRFTQGILPNDIVRVAGSSSIPIDDLHIIPLNESRTEFVSVANKREDWLNKWASSISMARIISLTMTDITQYGKKHQEWVKEGQKTHLGGVDASQEQFDSMSLMKDLREQMQAGKITQAEYMEQLELVTLRAQFARVPKDIKDEALSVLNRHLKEKYQADPMAKSSYPSHFANFLMYGNLSMKESLKAADTLYEEYKTLIPIQPKTREQNFRFMTITMVEPMITGRPDEEEYRKTIENKRREFLDSDMDINEVVTWAGTLSKDLTLDDIGTVDVTKYREALIKQVKDSCSIQELAENIDALTLTALTQPASFSQDLYLIKGYNDLKNKLKTEDKLSDGDIAELDVYIRAPFQDVITRLKELNAPKEIKTKFELGLAAVWISATEKFDYTRSSQDSKNYTTGKYTFGAMPDEIGAHIKKMMDHALVYKDEFGPRYTQQIYNQLAKLASATHNFELAKEAVNSSLKETEGQVTEAVLSPIPEVLGGFYEEKGELASAKKYYDLALEALRLSTVRWQADMIVYRAMNVYDRLGDKKKALEVAGNYLSTYNDYEYETWLPHKGFAEDMTEKLASELGYGSVKDALHEIIPNKKF